MLKLLLLSISFCLIQSISTACPDKILYCFDMNGNRVGEINVGQCFRWTRFSCTPCSSEANGVKISYLPYIHHCRYFFPETAQVLETISVRGDRLKEFKDGILG
jgi:hypothetical protein